MIYEVYRYRLLGLNLYILNYSFFVFLQDMDFVKLSSTSSQTLIGAKFSFIPDFIQAPD